MKVDTTGLPRRGRQDAFQGLADQIAAVHVFLLGHSIQQVLECRCSSEGDHCALRLRRFRIQVPRLLVLWGITFSPLRGIRHRVGPSTPVF